jgi:hypothetical protein
MPEWQTRRTTAALAIAGAILTLVFNALHPHPSDPTPEAFLRLVAAHSYWVTLHLGLSLGVLLIVGALAGLTDALRETPGALRPSDCAVGRLPVSGQLRHRRHRHAGHCPRVDRGCASRAGNSLTGRRRA